MSEKLHRDSEGGLRCRNCGCADFRVLWTYQTKDGIRRRRRCRYCGREFTTVERTLADAGPAQNEES